MKKRNIKYVCLLGIVLAIGMVMAVISMSMGSYEIPFDQVVGTLMGRGGRLETIAIWNIRLPRILTGILVGVALSTSGAIMQGVTRNDLAEPGLLGVNAGAAMAVVLFIGAGSGKYYEELGAFTVYALPFVAIAGAFLAFGLIYALAYKNGISPIRFLLMGIGINSGLMAVITLYQMNFKQQDFNRVLVWTSGSLWGSSWNYFFAILPPVLLALFFTWQNLRQLDVFALGDEAATGLGISVHRVRTRLLLLAAVLAASATAVAGSISFLGLLAPHIAKRLVGPKHGRFLPLSGAISVAIIILADALSRNLFAPIEIPVGLTISLLGVPYFLYLMLRGDSHVS